MEKKVPQTILASPYTNGNVGEKVSQTILASLYNPPPLAGNAHGNNTFQKGASLDADQRLTLSE